MQRPISDVSIEFCYSKFNINSKDNFVRKAKNRPPAAGEVDFEWKEVVVVADFVA